jgi:hypothetical protein
MQIYYAMKKHGMACQAESRGSTPYISWTARFMGAMCDIKKTMFFPVCVLVFFLCAISGSAAEEVSCSIVDWNGHEISSATTSDIVFLVAAIPVKRPKSLIFKTTIQYHSSDPRLYTISQSFNGRFYHEGGMGTEYYTTAIWIPDSPYIHDVTIKTIFPGVGKCTRTLDIAQ